MTEAAPRDVVLHLTDFHFWELVRDPRLLLNKRALGNVNVWLRRRHEFGMERAAPHAAHVASLGVPTLILGGDFTSTATEGEFALARDFVQTLADTGATIHLMPGNHDVYTFEAVRRRRFERHFGEWLPPGGYPARTTLPGGTPLILAPTVCPNILSSAGRITAAEAAAVARLIAGAPPGPVLVAGHYPALHRTRAYHSPPSRQLRGAARLLDALRSDPSRPVCHVAGHVHRFSHTRDAAAPGLVHVTSGAFFLKRRHEDRDGAFTEIRIHDGGFAVIDHGRAGGAWRADPSVAGAPPA